MGTAIAPSRYAISQMTDVEVYKVGAECVITLQPSTGFVSVQSSWHPELNGCHYWSARGSEDLKTFLVGLHRDYTVGKLFKGNALEEFDLEKSQDSARKDVIELRRDRAIDAEQARDLWNDIDNCETIDDIARLSIDEAWRNIQMNEKPCVAWFWDDVWAAFIAHLRTELAGS